MKAPKVLYVSYFNLSVHGAIDEIYLHGHARPRGTKFYKYRLVPAKRKVRK